MTMATERPYLTLEQVAARLQLNTETVRRWLRAGTLKGVLISQQVGWRIDPEELDRFLRERGNQS